MLRVGCPAAWLWVPHENVRIRLVAGGKCMRGWRMAWVACIWCFVALARAGTPPALELVDTYHGGVDLSRYWVSEKFDGVRGYWDGHHLWTRGGERVRVPDWFTRHWPDVPMDGAVWAGYGKLARASAIVRSAGPEDPAWQEISYRVFALPAYGGDFDRRVPAIRRIVAVIDDPWVVAIRQFHVDDEAALPAALDRVLAKGGERLVLHSGGAPYRAWRSLGLVKLQTSQDAAARVMAYDAD